MVRCVDMLYVILGGMRYDGYGDLVNCLGRGTIILFICIQNPEYAHIDISWTKSVHI